MKRFLIALSLVAFFPIQSDAQVTRMAVIQRVTDGDTVVLRDGTRVRGVIREITGLPLPKP